jgi:hypothetical protein
MSVCLFLNSFPILQHVSQYHRYFRHTDGVYIAANRFLKGQTRLFSTRRHYVGALNHKQSPSNSNYDSITWKEEKEIFDFVVTESHRIVPPYNFTYTTRVKERWIGRSLDECMAAEFPHYPDPMRFFADAACDGRLLVNGAPPSSTAYVLRGADVVEHRVHRHEPAVTSAPLRLVASTDALLAIDKPSSVPVHPGGRFRRNSVLGILAREGAAAEGAAAADGAAIDNTAGAADNIATAAPPLLCRRRFWDLHTVHRLDRLTSGLLLLARTPAAAEALRRRAARTPRRPLRHGTDAAAASSRTRRQPPCLCGVKTSSTVSRPSSCPAHIQPRTPTDAACVILGPAHSRSRSISLCPRVDISLSRPPAQ